MKKILYVRSGPYQVSIEGYNLQEIALAKAMHSLGYQMDLVFYTKGKEWDQTYKEANAEITIFWRKGLRLLRSGIFPQLCNKEFLNKYDAVIVSEYSQIMGVILGMYVENLYIYNGPYYNLFKIPLMQSAYDYLFVNYINRHVKKIFCKTSRSEEFLNSKGLTNTCVVGVGLDTDKFEGDDLIEDETSSIIKRMAGHRNLLYVGSLTQRKNVKLLYRVFDKIKQTDGMEDVQFIVIGEGNSSYKEECLEELTESSKKDHIYVKYVRNSELKYIYPEADIFLLPSLQEIFGMVLLEAMHFGVCTVASRTAGSETLIENECSGYIIDDFSEEKWFNKIVELLNNPNKRNFLGENARIRINTSFRWDDIASKMLKIMKL